MTESPHILDLVDLTDAVQAVLDAAPVGLPSELRESLVTALAHSRGHLPSHLFYATVEQAPIAISITDPDANMLYVNPAFERVTGYTRREVVGSNESLLSDKCTPVEIYRELWRELLAQRAWSGRLVNRRKNGERYLAQLMIAPVIDAGGVTRHYLGLHRDVTDLHRLECEVLNQKQRVETTLDLAPMAIALLDETGRPVLDNRAYRRLATESGRDPATFLLPAGHRWSDTNADGLAFMDQEICIDSGAPRWFSASGTWIHERDDGAGAFFQTTGSRHLLLVAQEITHLKQQQEEVRRNALRALIAEEALVQGLREAIAAAGFQLQGPFNMLKAALGILERRGDEHNHAVIDVLRQALASGHQALGMLRNAMPRAQPEAPARINLNQSLRDVLSLETARMLALGIQVDWRPATVLPAVMGCENRLRAALKQLVDNALDAMESPAVRRRELHITTAADEEAIRVVIEDTGAGIPPDLRLKIFEPFFSTKAAAGHAGMGLPMVREVINQHQGTLWLETGDEGGCRVHLHLPLRESATSQERHCDLPTAAA